MARLPGDGSAGGTRRGPPLSVRYAYGGEADEAPMLESARHELEAAREALRTSKTRHVRELDGYWLDAFKPGSQQRVGPKGGNRLPVPFLIQHVENIREYPVPPRLQQRTS